MLLVDDPRLCLPAFAQVLPFTGCRTTCGFWPSVIVLPGPGWPLRKPPPGLISVPDSAGFGLVWVAVRDNIT